MPYELTITQAKDLSACTISLGENKAGAESVLSVIWHDLLMDGYIAISNMKKPNFIEVVQRRGPTQCFIELRYQPKWDIGNILALFNLLALDTLYPRYLGTGLLQAEVVKSEQRWATAKYHAIEITPKGTVLKHALPGERSDALKAFAALVQERQNNGDTVRRNPDADMKYSAMGNDGLTMFELVEVAK